MDVRVGGLEDYWGMPVGGVQRIVLFDGQDFDNVRNLRGAEHQERNQHLEETYKDSIICMG